MSANHERAMALIYILLTKHRFRYVDITRTMGVADRTIYKWISKDTKIPNMVVNFLELLVVKLDLDRKLELSQSEKSSPHGD